MAAPAGLAAVCAVEIILHIIPVSGMRIYNESLTGAVTLQTHIPVGVARLAGGKTAPGLAGVGIGPIMDRQNRIHMAGLTGQRIETVMKD